MFRFFKRVIFSRSFMTAMLILLQLAFYIVISTYLFEYSFIIQVVSYILCAFLAIYILGLKNGSLDVKLPWVIFILLFPVFGSLFYFFFNNQRVRKKVRKNLESQIYGTKNIDYPVKTIYNELKEKNKSVYNQSYYIYKTTNLPIYQNSISTYFDSGEKYYESLIQELKKAEKFIFIEYFIINQGKMWDSILDILKEKAEKGLEIRVIYDDFGCINTLPYKYKKQIEQFKIKCEAFNPIYPITTLAHNNRDHRKIVVIDGVTAFTGGINISDEYINEINRFGHWKDSGTMIKGEAVKSFTLMFLESWHIYRDKNENYSPFLPKIDIIKIPIEKKKRRLPIRRKKSKKKKELEIKQNESNLETFTYTDNWEYSKEFIQPYMTTPMEMDEIVGRNVYVNILNSATNYVYITTPYLILDQELEQALINAAKRSVDVRIITPGIPDKRYVYSVTRSEYINLLKNGVSIYEYTPGFIHAKNVVSDDLVATNGSINFDNRSFYHSYECGVFIYNSPSVTQIRDDFLEAQKKSKKVMNDFADKVPFLIRVKTSLFRLLIPLL